MAAVTANFPLISIHVLRVEDDYDFYTSGLEYEQFQSTSSVWRTTIDKGETISPHVFQSTSSVWRTTVDSGDVVKAIRISIHVLRVEDDP